MTHLSRMYEEYLSFGMIKQLLGLIPTHYMTSVKISVKISVRICCWIYIKGRKYQTIINSEIIEILEMGMYLQCI